MAQEGFGHAVKQDDVEAWVREGAKDILREELGAKIT